MGERKRLAWGVVAAMVLAAWMAGQAAGDGNDNERKEREADQADSIALIDIGKVLQRHAAFPKRLKELQQEVKEYEADMRRRKEDFEEAKKLVEQLEEGTEAHREEQQRAARLAIDLKADAEQRKKAFLQREADLYAEAYREVAETVEQYAAARGIRLVLRYKSDANLHSNNREEIQKTVAKPVVYQRGLDITEDIVTLINGT